VRRGEFTTRSDWEERGGKPLTPLGSVVFETEAPEGWSPFVVNEGGEGADEKLRQLTAKLRSTSTKGGIAELAYDLIDPDGVIRAHVKERPRDVVVSDGSGILQAFEFTAAQPAKIICSFTSKSDSSLPLPRVPDGRAKDEHSFDKNLDHWADQKELLMETKWWVVRPDANTTLAVRIEVEERHRPGHAESQGPRLTVSEDRNAIGAFVTADTTPMTLRRIVIARGSTTLEQLQKMSAETQEIR
jgi:hypothetical protein